MPEVRRLLVFIIKLTQAQDWTWHGELYGLAHRILKHDFELWPFGWGVKITDEEMEKREAWFYKIGKSSNDSWEESYCLFIFLLLILWGIK